MVCTEPGLFQMQKRKRLQSGLPTVKRHSLFASQGEPHDPGAAPHGEDHRPPQEGRAPVALVLLGPKARACHRSGLAFPPGPPGEPGDSQTRFWKLQPTRENSEETPDSAEAQILPTRTNHHQPPHAGAKLCSHTCLPRRLGRTSLHPNQGSMSLWALREDPKVAKPFPHITPRGLVWRLLGGQGIRSRQTPTTPAPS